MACTWATHREPVQALAQGQSGMWERVLKKCAGRGGKSNECRLGSGDLLREEQHFDTRVLILEKQVGLIVADHLAINQR